MACNTCKLAINRCTLNAAVLHTAYQWPCAEDTHTELARDKAYVLVVFVAHMTAYLLMIPKHVQHLLQHLEASVQDLHTCF